MNCNTCGAGNRELLWNINGFDIYKCKNCDLIYAIVHENDLENAYETDYYKKVYPDYEADKKVYDLNSKLTLKLMEKYSNKGKLLEIGCAFGFFLKFAKDTGWETTGFEISKYASKLAKEKYRINVINSNFLTYQSDEKYDFACLFDTIEHLQDPSSMIKKVAEALKPSSKIIITTGNIDALSAKVLGSKWRLLAPPLHIYYYTPKTLSALLEKHGFKVLTVKHTGKYFNIGSILKFFLGINKDKLPVVPIKINLGDIMTIIAEKK